MPPPSSAGPPSALSPDQQQSYNVASLAGCMLSMFLFGLNAALFYSIFCAHINGGPSAVRANLTTPRRIIFGFACVIFGLNVVDAICLIQIVVDIWGVHVAQMGAYVNLPWYLARSIALSFAILVAQWSLCYRVYTLYSHRFLPVLLPFLLSLLGFIPPFLLFPLIKGGSTSINNIFVAADTIIKLSLAAILTTDITLTSLLCVRLWRLAAPRPRSDSSFSGSGTTRTAAYVDPIAPSTRARLYGLIRIFLESALLVDAVAFWQLIAYARGSYSHQTAQYLDGQLYGIASLIVLSRTVAKRRTSTVAGGEGKKDGRNAHAQMETGRIRGPRMDLGSTAPVLVGSSSDDDDAHHKEKQRSQHVMTISNHAQPGRDHSTFALTPFPKPLPSPTPPQPTRMRTLSPFRRALPPSPTRNDARAPSPVLIQTVTTRETRHDEQQGAFGSVRAFQHPSEQRALRYQSSESRSETSADLGPFA